MSALSQLAEDADRVPTEEETETYDGLKAELDDLGIRCQRLEAQAEIERGLIPPDGEDTATAEGVADPNQPKADAQSWKNMGEFLGAVVSASTQHPSQYDSRLVAPMAATGLGETVGSEGGFLVQTDFVSQLMMKTYESNAILGGTGYSTPTRIPISANSNAVKINAVNETSRVDGSRWGLLGGRGQREDSEQAGLPAG
jgi:HK97 family phage major capsid protein